MRPRSPFGGHCIALDGVRGLAAVSVLFFHLGRWLDIPGCAVNGGLSVDTFFTLSGYVLARSYAGRRELLSMSGFIALRLMRLMPIIVLSLFISAPYVIAKNLLANGDPYLGPVAVALLLGSMSVPYFNASPQIGGPQVFPLNGPQFSLFLELAANYFWWLLRFGNQYYRSLALYIVFGVIVIATGIGGDTADNFLLGFGHVGASFFVGVHIYYLGTNLGGMRIHQYVFFALVLLMIFIFFSPFELSLHERLVWKLLLAPLLVMSGATVVLPSCTDRFSSLLGELSYPVYALHYPIFCWVNGACQKLLGNKNIALEGFVFIVICFMTSYVVLNYYDKPLRRYLIGSVSVVGRPPRGRA